MRNDKLEPQQCDNEVDSATSTTEYRTDVILVVRISLVLSASIEALLEIKVTDSLQRSMEFWNAPKTAKSLRLSKQQHRLALICTIQRKLFFFFYSQSLPKISCKAIHKGKWANTWNKINWSLCSHTVKWKKYFPHYFCFALQAVSVE